jgi:transcriptional regulator with PAS, ATPase and Fis domain
MVAQGRFRQDFYYRINVMRIEAPVLQERREDIPLIAMYFLRHYSELYKKPMSSIDPEAMAALECYAWPGNVRELENVMQRAIILSQGISIAIDDLPQHLQEDGVVGIDDYRPAGSFERQLRDYKIKLAVNAVREHNGNKTLAARSLQISRAYLHRLLRSAGQDVDQDQDRAKLELA